MAKAKAEKADSEPVAKKDFVIRQNDFYLEIKAGDGLGKVPEIYLPNLKTEGVI